MMMKTRWPKQAGVLLPGILCAIVIWHAGAGVARAACNAPDATDYSMDMEVTHQEFYPAGVETQVIVTVSGYEGGTQPVELSWEGIVNGSTTVIFDDEDYTIILPVSVMTPGDKQLKIKARNAWDDYPEENNCWVEKTIQFTVLKVESVELVGAPADGLVVKKGDNVTMKANIEPTTYIPPTGEPKWYYQRLKSDGWEPTWTSFGASAHGKTYTHTTAMSGSFRVKTVLSVGGSVLCEKIYERTADEAYGPGLAGAPDAFGVADTDYQIALRNSAKNWLGNTSYRVACYLPPLMGFPERPNPSNKCNLFVAHRAHASGAVVPLLGGSGGVDPPSANQWAGQDDTHYPLPLGTQTDIGDWTLLADPYPQPGFIVAHPILTGSGHVGIVDYDGEGIAAGTFEVNKNFGAFLDGTSGFRKYEP